MDLLADVKYAFRLLKKSPVFTVAAVATLALGIGANTAIFSAVHSVLVRPLPYTNPDELVMVWEDATMVGFPRNTPAPGNYKDWRVLNRSFVDMAATRGGTTASLTMDGPPEQVIGRAVTANFFGLLGVQPQLGRAFTPGDDATGAQVVIISHALWQRRFGGDPEIVGRTMLMSGARHQIVGVAPKAFVFRDRDIDYWIPMRLPPQLLDTRRAHFLNVVARLKPGVPVQAADAEMKSIAARLMEQHPDTNREVGAVVVPLREEVLGDTRIELIVLMAAGTSIVLIACANLASLLMSRASARRGEYAVRLSLGATRARLARQIVIEALCLSLVGGALGLAVPALASTMIERLVPVGLQLSTAWLVDWRLFAFAASSSIATGLFFSLGPALQSSRASTAEALQQSARGAIGGGAARGIRDGLLVLQVAATLVLLVAAGLMLRTLANLRAIELGFNPGHLLTMQVALPQPKYAEPARRAAFFDRVASDIRAQPGVDGAAFGSTLPFQSIGNTQWFTIEGRQESPEEIRDALYRVGTADYMRTLGIAPAEGRLIDERDTAGAPRAAVVNQTLARRFLPNQSAVGRRIRFDTEGPWFTIVGVVRDVLERGYEQEDKPAVYVSSPQVSGNPSNLIVRVAGEPLASAAAVQRVIRSVDPDQPVRLIRSMSDVVNLTVSDRQQHATLLAVFGGLALLIAAIGLYGLLAQSVSARSREIGLRIALGATWRSVVGMVMSRGILLTGVGVVLGAVIAWMATRAMQTLLYGVSAGDPMTFATVLGLLATVAVAACAIPAARAARVDPMIVLRDQ
jgi:putative ABC transport system permease protein